MRRVISAVNRRRATYAITAAIIAILIYNSLDNDLAFTLVVLTTAANFATRWLLATSNWDIVENPRGKFDVVCHRCDTTGQVGVITHENLSLPAALHTAHRHYRTIH
jgi:hypothetical protein